MAVFGSYSPIYLFPFLITPGMVTRAQSERTLKQPSICSPRVYQGVSRNIAFMSDTLHMLVFPRPTPFQELATKEQEKE